MTRTISPMLGLGGSVTIGGSLPHRLALRVDDLARFIASGLKGGGTTRGIRGRHLRPTHP